jgi:hypothetical protein
MPGLLQRTATAGQQQALRLPPDPSLMQARRWDLRQSLMLLALLAIWLYARPWAGIWHTRLYAVQARLLLPSDYDPIKAISLAVAEADDPAFDSRYFLYDCARLRAHVASH